MTTPFRKGPWLRLQSQGEESQIFQLSLTQARERIIVRITGGCGFMSDADGRGLHDLIVPAFDGFRGAMLYGGTRIVSLNDPWKISHSITEIPPTIRNRCPEARIHGVIPRTEHFSIDSLGRLLISVDAGEGKISVVHPDQDEVLVVQEGVDKPTTWAGEYAECLKITANLREHAKWKSVLLCYNGGKYTAEEAWEVQKRGWPVILIRGSGRKTDELANTAAFTSCEHVRVVDKTTAALRLALEQLGVVPCALSV